MPYGYTHTSTIPTVSSTVGPTYATQVNAALGEIRATLDAKVTPAGMDMNAALSFLSGAAYYPITNLERLNLQNKSAAINATTYPVALYAVSGDLYYNDNSGRQVRVTNGGALNIAATGGITGTGYGSSGVEVNWAVADLAYKLKSGAASYASAWMNDLYLNDGDTNFVRITAQAMAADYALTLPAALPASTSLLTLTSGGAIAASRDPSVDTVTTTGNAAIGGTTTSTGLITATAGLTAAVNQHVTVSGSGRFKHGTRTQIISAFAGQYEGSEWTYDAGAGVVGLRMNAAGAGAAAMFPITLDQGKQITSVTVNIEGDAVNRLTCELFYVTAAGDRTPVGSGDSIASAGDQSVSVFSGTQTVSANQGYYVSVGLRTGSAPDNTLRIFTVSVQYNEP